MDNTSTVPGPPESTSHGGASQLNSANRRPSVMSPIGVDRKMLSPSQNLTLTIHKDSSGYGMKVSGDNPVYVESVKPGGAAQKAGLIEGDMILKVNGKAVRFSTHLNVVELIKACAAVELTVQRNYKMQRSSSVSAGPLTPLAQRGGITAPLPVDLAKRREMEYSKMTTLRLMLDQEMKNLENLKQTSGNNRNEIARAEATIAKLNEQLKQMCGEDPTLYLLNPIPTPMIVPTILQPQPPAPVSSSPAFLSRFPRSLSSLSLGGKRKSVEKENTTVTPQNPMAHADMLSPHSAVPASTSHGFSMASVKNKFTGSTKDLKHSGSLDQPPPLPQRNFMRSSQTTSTFMDPATDHDVVFRKSTQVSDLDTFYTASSSTSNPSNDHVTGTPPITKVKKRSKVKAKANSDPKISSHLFIQMEKGETMSPNKKIVCETGLSVGNKPPPLPPRQPGMIEENPTLVNKFSSGAIGKRPPPNSLDTLMNYPLIATCTAIKDNNVADNLTTDGHSHPQSNNNKHLHYSCSNAKSTALGLTPQQLNQFQSTSSHRRAVSSPAEPYGHEADLLDLTDDAGTRAPSGKWDHATERDSEMTLSGTPPPPYLANYGTQKQQQQHQPDGSGLAENTFDSASSTAFPNISAAQSKVVQRQILSMEDDDVAEDQDSISEDHGPFRSIQQLLEHENLAYLAVFLNFVLSNSNPSPLLFYLITGLYKEGSVKDMRKWAYEIHSTFLVPRAPLLWNGVDESLAREIDDVLQNEYDKSEILRKIFWKSRHRAKEYIIQQLDDFQVKRTAGLGTMFGPTDQQLIEAKGDKLKEQRIFEDTLLPKLQQLIDELEKEPLDECSKKSALSSALSTVLHRIFITRSIPNGPIERVHHFVSREKSFKNRLIGKNRKIQVRGHHLVLKQYYEVAHCNHCQNIIWGVSPQGYHCTDCELNIHRSCTRILEENCPGPVPTKRKEQHADNKMSRLMEKIRPTNYFIQAERTRRQDEECGAEFLFTSDSPTSASIFRHPSDCRTDMNASTTSSNHIQLGDIPKSQSIDADASIHDSDMENRHSSKSKSAPVSVNRSESYKERLSHKRNRNNRRKTSDPSLTKSNDEPQGELGINNENFTASSSSSLSSSTSLEAVTAPPHTGHLLSPRQWMESDDETNDAEADWSSNVGVEILQTLSVAEKKRQEIINEIYQTERNHVRTLRLLEGIFMRPLQESSVLNAEDLNLLFPPSLLTLKDLHGTFEQQLKQRRQDHGPLVGDIGDLLLSMFDGRMGDELRENAAQFCARQQIALEALKEKRRKDESLQRLLTKAESHKACRRLQLKDLLPTALQRLTKYPLLFESLVKITVQVAPDNELEAQAIHKALDSSRRILNHVNHAVRIAEDTHKLQAIQKRLDKSSYDKDTNSEFKNLDLTQHKLIYDGPLIMKKNPGIQLHGLLFESMMVLLIKQDDKYILKNQSNPGLGSGESKSIEGRFNPITKINLIFVRQSAVEKNSFFLINTNVSQMLELTAPSSSECKTWFKHISETAEAYKSRIKSSNDHSTDDSSAVQSNTLPKEDQDGTNEKNGAAARASAPPTVPITISNQTTPSSNQKDENETTSLKRSSTQTSRKASFSKDDETRPEPTENSNKFGEFNDDESNLDSNKCETPIYSNSTTSSSTRTLTQQSSLVAPSEICVSISPSLTAEPVVTPSERLQRLDEAIRLQIAEKQKIVCDLFRVPNEHFAAIADIAGQPEASKDPTETVLAAFAQVQSLTEALNEYINVSVRTELSPNPLALCDDCHKSQKIQTRSRNSNSSSSTVTTVVRNTELPGSDQASLVNDDDGYCEIDEIRLPTVQPIKKASKGKSKSSSETKSTTKPSSSTNDTTADTTCNENNTAEQLTAATVETDDTITQLGSSETANNNDEHIATPGVAIDVDNDDSTIKTEAIQSDAAPVVAATAIGFEDQIEFNDASDSISQQTADFNPDSETTCEPINCTSEMCQRNQLISPSTPLIPCHLITTYVLALNQHISLLLPRLHERDIERDKLRRENQHLRDLLSSVHERDVASNINKESTENRSENDDQK